MKHLELQHSTAWYESQGSRFAFLSFCTELQHSEQQNFGLSGHGILKVRSGTQEVAASRGVTLGLHTGRRVVGPSR